MNTNRTAFTLVELLIATAIVTLVVAVAFGTNMIVASSVNRVSAAIDDSEIAERAVRAIAAQLNSMAVPTENFSSRPGTDSPQAAEFAFNTEPGRSGTLMAFISSRPLFDPHEGGYFQVRYRLDPLTGALIASQQPYIPGQGAIPQGEISQTVFSDVLSISAEYFDGEKWHSRLRPEENVLPVMIRLNIARLQNGRTTEHRITSTIFRASGGNVRIETKK